MFPSLHCWATEVATTQYIAAKSTPPAITFPSVTTHVVRLKLFSPLVVKFVQKWQKNLATIHRRERREHRDDKTINLGLTGERVTWTNLFVRA